MRGKDLLWIPQSASKELREIEPPSQIDRYYLGVSPDSARGGALAVTRGSLGAGEQGQGAAKNPNSMGSKIEKNQKETFCPKSDFT